MGILGKLPQVKCDYIKMVVGNEWSIHRTSWNQQYGLELKLHDNIHFHFFPAFWVSSTSICLKLDPMSELKVGSTLDLTRIAPAHRPKIECKQKFLDSWRYRTVYKLSCCSIKSITMFTFYARTLSWKYFSRSDASMCLNWTNSGTFSNRNIFCRGSDLANKVQFIMTYLPNTSNSSPLWWKNQKINIFNFCWMASDK